MNLFVAGWSDARPVEAGVAMRALGQLLARLPFFPESAPQQWSSSGRRAAAAWIAHPPEKIGGHEYAMQARDWIYLWSGHRGSRFVEVGATEQALHVDQSPMGSYPVYEAVVDDIRWVSNNPTLLRELTGDRGIDESVAASLLAGGWSLSGDPLWRGVRRIPTAGPDPIPLIGRGLDALEAAAELVDVTRALMDWPGRPNVVPVTAGRDSRLVLAAATKTGIAFEANTGGRPGEPEVEVGRQLAEIAGVKHWLIPDDPHGSLHADWRRAAELLELTTGGTASLADAVGFPHGPRKGPLPLWHSGQGGEIARSYYARAGGRTRGQLADSLYTVFAMRRPGRREPLNDHGEALVRDQITAWVDQVLQAGASPADVPDLFYLQKRMGTWAGPTHGAVEYVRDTTSPLWHERMLPHLLALPAADRAAERFHHEVLNELSPELAGAPGWFKPTTKLERRAARAQSLTRKAITEARRRTRRGPRQGTPVPGQPTPPDPFDTVRAELRQAVADQPQHAAWNVLDRSRAEALLGAPDLDDAQRYYAWRIATLFGSPR